MANNTIVLIDDSETVLTYMKHYLNKVGFNCICFKFPLDAIKEIPLMETPAIIVCDYIMFDKEGFSVIEELREAGVYTRYILFTSFHSDDVAKLCAELNIIFMRKELNTQKVIEVVRCL